MQLPFLDPMFDARQDVLGLPADVVLLAVAAALLLTGNVLIRRITRVERAPRSFRATAGQDATWQLTRGIAFSLAILAAIVVLVLLVR